MLSGYLEIQAAIDSSRSKLCMLSAAGQLGCWIEFSHGERTCVREWVGWDGSLRHICKSAEVPVLLVGSRVAGRYFFCRSQVFWAIQSKPIYPRPYRSKRSWALYCPAVVSCCARARSGLLLLGMSYEGPLMGPDSHLANRARGHRVDFEGGVKN